MKRRGSWLEELIKMKEKMFWADDALRLKANKRIDTLRDAGTKRLLHRVIEDACPFLGSYGMGGAGFFGWKLKKFRKFPEEWLVLTLWGSDEWLLVNDKPLSSSCHKPFVDSVMPREMTNFSSQNQFMGKLFTGYSIREFSVTHRGFRMVLKRQGKKTLVVEVPEDLTKLSKYGNGEPRIWKTSEEMIDGILISETEFIDI